MGYYLILNLYFNSLKTMRPQTPIDDNAKSSLYRLLKETNTKNDFRRVQCVWMRAEFGFNSSVTAKIVGLSPGSVRRIWSSYLKNGEASLLGCGRGGRRRSHMSSQEEEYFLRPFFKRMSYESVSISDIQTSYENTIGKRVPKSTIYRLLARHGWKKTPSSRSRTDKHLSQADLVFF